MPHPSVGLGRLRRLGLGGGAVAGPLAQRSHRRLALLALGAIEDQDAVEVVDLVLEHARLEPRGLEQQRPALDVDAADAGVQRALDVDPDPRAG